MKTVSLEFRNGIAVLRLNNGVTNSVSPQLVHDLEAALDASRETCRGLILAGGDKFFSIGFDLPTLMPLKREAVAEFYRRFNQTVLDLFTLRVPTLCAISGHAIAGGTILALTCDYRLAAQKKKLLGLNEIKLGVPVPHLADLMLRHIIAERDATAILYGGEFLTAGEAFKIGLIDEICTPETVEARACEKLMALAALPACAFSRIKESRVEFIRSRFLAECSRKTNEFLDCWFDPAVRELLVEASRKF